MAPMGLITCDFGALDIAADGYSSLGENVNSAASYLKRTFSNVNIRCFRFDEGLRPRGCLLYYAEAPWCHSPCATLHELRKRTRHTASAGVGERKDAFPGGHHELL